MRKKQLNIKMNPFDKTKTAAENMFAPPDDNIEHVGDIGDIGDIGDVEQQNQHVQLEQQIQQSQLTQQVQLEQQSQPEPAKKKAPRQFPGRQHIHLILPDKQANAIKTLARYSGVSINQLMIDAIDQMYDKKWKAVIDQVELVQQKLGLNQKTNKDIF